MNTRKKHVLLYFTHVFDKSTMKEFGIIENAFKPYGEAYLITYENTSKNETVTHPPNLYRTNKEKLKTLNYRWMHSNLMPGHTNYPIMHFALSSDYDSFTVIEYDVRLRGKWDQLFKELMKSNADFLATHLTKQSEQPDWPHWSSINIPKNSNIQSEFKLDLIRSFCPIYKISRDAIKVLDKTYKSGVIGHYEALFPTILKYFKLKVCDINSLPHPIYTGKYRWYTQADPDKMGSLKGSSMRFKPPFYLKGLRPLTLYHPIKYSIAGRIKIGFRHLSKTIQSILNSKTALTPTHTQHD